MKCQLEVRFIEQSELPAGNSLWFWRLAGDKGNATQPDTSSLGLECVAHISSQRKHLLLLQPSAHQLNAYVCAVVDLGVVCSTVSIMLPSTTKR